MRGRDSGTGLGLTICRRRIEHLARVIERFRTREDVAGLVSY